MGRVAWGGGNEIISLTKKFLGKRKENNINKIKSERRMRGELFGAGSGVERGQQERQFLVSVLKPMH